MISPENSYDFYSDTLLYNATVTPYYIMCLASTKDCKHLGEPEI